ncbi:cell division protein FtsQ/DivIB [Lawsonella clevelandensis]|uniref:cell division protein FtsQ/DivIB n=1 Tax=Lawsonella clevelandensis TaxID=1528099 RepID=UPI0023F08CB1|nr:FtsQ-type POTRA domain-containing protein [Lawsonella clevelandensis]
MSEERRAALSHALRTVLQTVLGLVLAVTMAVAIVLFTTSLFLVTETSVTGLRVLSQQQVLRQAQVPMETRMAELSTHDVALRVAALPRVKRVRVEKSYPHLVTIAITERVPVAYFAAGGKLYEMDAAGVAMAVRRPTLRIPEIVVPDPLHNTLQREAALKTAQELPQDIVRRVRTIDVTSAAMVVLRLRDGRTVELGSPTRLEEKVQSMRIVLTQSGTTWNVSNPELPTRR